MTQINPSMPHGRAGCSHEPHPQAFHASQPYSGAPRAGLRAWGRCRAPCWAHASCSPRAVLRDPWGPQEALGCSCGVTLALWAAAHGMRPGLGKKHDPSIGLLDVKLEISSSLHAIDPVPQHTRATVLNNRVEKRFPSPGFLVSACNGSLINVCHERIVSAFF